LRGLVGDPLLVGGLGPGAPLAPLNPTLTYSMNHIKTVHDAKAQRPHLPGKRTTLQNFIE